MDTTDVSHITMGAGKMVEHKKRFHHAELEAFCFQGQATSRFSWLLILPVQDQASFIMEIRAGVGETSGYVSFD